MTSVTEHNIIRIPLSIDGKSINFKIKGERSNCYVIHSPEATEMGEACFQIFEGSFYQYKIEEPYYLDCPTSKEIVTPNVFNSSTGRIAPNIYVGTLDIDVVKKDTQKVVTKFSLEVQSQKINYRDDYRHMLSDITEKCVDLLLQHDSPVYQHFTIDFNADAKTLYQRFAFIKSVIDSPEFNDSIQKIFSAPVTRWKDTESIKDIRNISRLNNSAMRQIAGNSNRMSLPNAHPLSKTLGSIPTHITTTNKTESIDTPENSFIKFALESFLALVLNFRTSLKSNRVTKEANIIIEKLEQFLQHSMFREIATLKTLPLNSPVLQRKEGYREVLRVWLMFDLASKLIWKGGDDVYAGNKKNIAILYEYWVFFKLLEIVKDVFKLDTYVHKKVLKVTDKSVDLTLKQGDILPIEGLFVAGTRKLRVVFNYNKTYGTVDKYPDGGSWTRFMRPDYSISIWPDGIDEETAEKEELIVHIHFDAKYKLDSMSTLFGTPVNVDKETQKQLEEKNAQVEKEEQIRGTYKRVDLLKMHAYKDAIRRTAGAYILYPGTEREYIKKGYHEIIPGLGAFPLRPGKSTDGSNEVRQFLREVLDHFLNRATQREHLSTKVYEIHKDIPYAKINQYLPEAIGDNRSFIPNETMVIIGYYKNANHYKWITQKGKYNFRTGEDKGSLVLEKDIVSARYLLLYGKNDTTSGDLWEITSKGPKVMTKDDLIKDGYTNPKHNYYLVITIKKVDDELFGERDWRIDKVKNYKGRGVVCVARLTELMM